jgi:predicted AAA+ superfamily ATPase
MLPRRLGPHVLGHPITGMSWEGYVIESLLRAAPARSQASFYRTDAGAEMDLVLELPGDRLWAVEIKRGVAPKLEKGFHNALDDLQPSEAFVVYSGTERYPKGRHIEVIGVRELARELASM